MKKQTYSNPQAHILVLMREREKKGRWWMESEKSSETAHHDEIRQNYLTYVTWSKASWLPASDNLSMRKTANHIAIPYRIESARME